MPRLIPPRARQMGPAEGGRGPSLNRIQQEAKRVARAWTMHGAPPFVVLPRWG